MRRIAVVLLVVLAAAVGLADSIASGQYYTTGDAEVDFTAGVPGPPSSPYIDIELPGGTERWYYNSSEDRYEQPEPGTGTFRFDGYFPNGGQLWLGTPPLLTVTVHLAG